MNTALRLTTLLLTAAIGISAGLANGSKPKPVIKKADLRAYSTNRKLDFVQDVVPVLTKQGCAGGSCHGSPQGKGSFSLSLFGYDPTMDQRALTRDSFARRIDTFVPDASLIIRKPMLKTPHLGGRKLRPTDTAYTVLRTWIAQGADATISTTECTKLTITPSTSQILASPGKQLPLRVVAHYSDGTSRDVTPIATFESAHPAVAKVSVNGLVTGSGRGQTAVSIRYLQHLESVPIKVLGTVKGYTWKPVREVNVVDKLVNQTLKQLSVTASPTCNDATFLRRVTIDLTGMLPSPDTARAFVADKSADKRKRMVDSLLASDAFARFWALKRADLLRVTDERMPHGRAALLTKWLSDGWKVNRPADVEAKALIATDGDTRSSAPANYLVAVTTPDDRTEMTAQTFMGTRINCAKCHNHPYEKWTMNDYYSIAAAFARTETDGFSVTSTSAGETKHPTKGRIMPPYGAAKGSEPANRRQTFASWLASPANPLFARTEVNRIWAELFGRGIVDPVDDFRASNPPSNAALLDMLTKRLETNGYDRKDIIRLICNSQTYQRSNITDAFNKNDDALFSHAKPRLLSAEQLLDAIGVVTGDIKTDTDLGPVLRTLTSDINATRAKLAGGYAAWLDGQKARYASAAVVAEPWELYAQPAGSIGDAVPFKDITKTPQTSWFQRDDIKDNQDVRFGHIKGGVYWVRRVINSRVAQTMDVNIFPADRTAVWVNGEVVPRGEREKRSLPLKEGINTVYIRCDMPDQFQPFWMRYRDTCDVDMSIRASIRQNKNSDDALLVAYDKSDGNLRGLLQDQNAFLKYDRYATQRSEPRPTQFLAAFGQPKRETACACERQTNPTLLQALELLNGSETYQRLGNISATYSALDDAAFIERIYLTAMSRMPVAKERDTALGFLTKAGDKAKGRLDFVWALLSTKEFLFQH